MGNKKRDDFTKKTKRILASRAGYKCSFPNCQQITSGPSSDGKDINLGEAAHISAAAPGGPRYNPNLTTEERSDISNGIWLCRHHANLIDKDPIQFSVEKLKEMKEKHEKKIQEELNRQRNCTTIIISNDGNIKNLDEFEAFLESCISDSTMLNKLKICIDTSKFDNVQGIHKEIILDSYKEREEKIKNIFYLLLSLNAKKFLAIYSLNNDDIKCILKNSISLLFENSAPTIATDEILIECFTSCKDFPTITPKVPIKKEYLLDCKKNNSWIENNTYIFDENLRSLGLSVGDVTNNDWKKRVFIPNLLVDTVTKLESDEINNKDFDFYSFYLLYNWKIGLA